MSIEYSDLSKIYIQNTPNRPLDLLFSQKKPNYLLSESPHFELASLYIKNGSKWLEKNYKLTLYYKMCKYFLKKNPVNTTLKMIKICDSIKKGYLRKGYENNYIVLLLEPFAISRYNREIEFLVPEIFSGHHRAAILLALGYKSVKVIIAEDVQKGFCESRGKIHDLCVKNNRYK